MAIRKTYQFNCFSTLNGDGLLLSQLADIKGRRTNYQLPFMADVSGLNRLLLGDSLAGGRSGVSLQTQIAGGFCVPNRTVVNGNQAVTVDDAVILCDTSLGSTTLDLPSVAAAAAANQILWIKKISAANSVILDPNGAQLIDGQATLSFSAIDESWCIYSDGTEWRILRRGSIKSELINDINPAATNTGVASTIATTAAFFFTGNPVLFALHGSMRNVNGANEFMLVDFTMRFDGAGVNFRLCQWQRDIAGDHSAFSGSRIVTPTRGVHTIDLRWQRLNGAGTATIDGNDFIFFNSLDV